MAKWQVRFCLDGEDKSEVFVGDYKENDVRLLLKARYPAVTDGDIKNVCGAFDSIPGRKLILGSHAINSSLDLGLPYAKSGNQFHGLIDPGLEELRKIVEKESGTPRAEEAKKSILDTLHSHGIGVADIIDYCVARSSMDKDIDSYTIEWNQALPDLIRQADVVYLNGKSSTANFLKMYCKECTTAKMRMDANYIYVGEHRTPYAALYSSSNQTRSKYHEKRKDQWKAITQE